MLLIADNLRCLTKNNQKKTFEFRRQISNPTYYNKEETIKLDAYMVFTIKILFIKKQILKNDTEFVLIKVC